MTKAEIITAVRNLVNEISTDTGALLVDAGNLLEYINDAMEQVVVDLIPIMPEQLLTSETVTLIANQANYTLTTSFLMVYKVEKNLTGEPPKEIEMINPLSVQFKMDVGETAEEPDACYMLGDVLYFVPTPASAKTNYAKVWLVRNEATTMATNGPQYLPAVTHRLIVYRAAALAAVSLEATANNFLGLYAQKLRSIERLWGGRFQQRPRFVQESVDVRKAYDSRDLATYDWEW